jgi:hypothetical protein
MPAMSRAECRFALAEQSSEEAGPAQMGLVHLSGLIA